MKKLLFILAIAGFCLVLSAQEKKDCKADTTKVKCKTELKEHVCTAACKDGKHVYACGEKGHTCTEACKKEVKK